jgi:hypothetical protein
VSIDVATTTCTAARCRHRAAELDAIRAALGPALTRGTSLHGVLSLVDQAKELLHERDAYRAALQRVHQLWFDAHHHNAGIVLVSDLASAMYCDRGEREP